MDFDLLLRGGTVVDPGQGVEGRLDVAFANGRVAGVAPNLSVTATEMIDGSGTTAGDAGSSGWAPYAGFREHVIDRAETRVLAFLHLAATGLVTLAAGVG